MNAKKLQALQAWLLSPTLKSGAMNIDQLQGFLCAVISSPEMIPPSRWLKVAVGEPEYESIEQAEEFLALITDFYQELSQQLHEGKGVKLILRPVKGEEQKEDYRPWCEGYISGWSLSSEEWLRPGNEALKHLTLPLLLLSGAFKEDAERRGEQFVEDEEYRDAELQCRQMLPEAVQGIYDFWLGKRKPAPARRSFPKVGRNDPCPCGSGKKFKQCCGGVLH